jgi:putative SOS response-associated peptidase YedK
MTLTLPDFEGLVAFLGVEGSDALRADHRPRFNVAPTDRHLLVIATAGATGPVRTLVRGRWGLGPRRTINARAETAGKVATFRTARRCVVPADGFYEWDPVTRVPRWFHAAAAPALLFAGIHDEALGFAVLTVGANPLVAAVHDRMPAILAANDVDPWLSGAHLALGPAADGILVAHDVDDRVGNVRNDDAACIAPRAAPKQGRLF